MWLPNLIALMSKKRASMCLVQGVMLITDHEQLDEISLVNIGGRIYDISVSIGRAGSHRRWRGGTMANFAGSLLKLLCVGCWRKWLLRRVSTAVSASNKSGNTKTDLRTVGKDSHASGKYDLDVENPHLDNVTQSKLTPADFLESFEKICC